MPYQPENTSVISKLLNGLAALLSRWPLILIALFLWSPEGPHLWFATQERAVGSFANRVDCIYLGSRGFVTAYVPDCPALVWLDSQEWQ